MSTDPNPTPELEKAYRDAHRALENIVYTRAGYHPGHVPESDLGLGEVLDQFPYLVREAQMTAVMQLGAPLGWDGTWPEDGQRFELIPATADLDTGVCGDGPDLAGALSGDWEGSPLDLAARAYRRECGWDFPPGEGGVWLLLLAPESYVGSAPGEPCSCRGRIAGFVILHDRDGDGEYESVAHIWTAQAWRRRGIASRLLAEARSRFRFTGYERPFTDAGAALIDKTADPGQAQP